MSEEQKIMDFFGFGQTEGEVRGEHFSTILSFLKNNSGKSWDFVKEVSPLFVHMHFRYINEGYVRGLVRLGIIKLFQNSNNKLHYSWIGAEALNGSVNKPDSLKPNPKLKEVKTEKENGLCPNCGKKPPKDNKFCNEECVKEYYEKKKKEKME